MQSHIHPRPQPKHISIKAKAVPYQILANDPLHINLAIKLNIKYLNFTLTYRIPDTTCTSDEEYFMDGGSAASETSSAPAQPLEEDVKRFKALQRQDVARVRDLVQRAGGLHHSKPLHPSAPPPKKMGMEIKVVNITMDEDAIPEPELKPDRPEESTLRRISRAELMPPPLTVPDDIIVDISAPLDLVKEQNIVFIVAMIDKDNPQGNLQTPNEETLEMLFDGIRENNCEMEDISDVAVSARLDRDSKLATITLNTINMRVFEHLRKEIREFSAVEGFTFETYSKLDYMSACGLTTYIPKSHKCYLPRAFMRFLFEKYPDLCSSYAIPFFHVFTEDHSNKIPGKRSRIGDSIVLLTGETLMD